jgi:hypothetical protein
VVGVIQLEQKETVYIHEGDIAQYVFNRLIEKGFALTNEEAFVLGEVFFDYLVEKDVLELDDIEEDGE